ncbi:PaRep2b protein [Pyrobaculum aerophilum]|uniref:PaRep2b protein n=1 Tax=Pyrobaculum aerophilum TaxID=13773 RepID=UPI00216228E2|nr:PaRep2b protein [Pyrobaculum aerophilum]
MERGEGCDIDEDSRQERGCRTRRQLGLDKGVVERAVSAFSTLRHAVAKEQVENAVLELRRLVNYVQEMKAAKYKKALEEASRAWYEERDPAALWALAVLGARETGIAGNSVFEDDDDKVAYLIASFTLLNHLREFVELRDRVYRALERLEDAVNSGKFTLDDFWNDLNALAEAEAKARKRAEEIAKEFNTISYKLEDAGVSGIAERLKVTTENVTALLEATHDDLSNIDATRGERAVAALLSLVTGGIFGVTVERALAERGGRTTSILSIVSALRNAPRSFCNMFKLIGREKPSENRKLVLHIISLFSDPFIKTELTKRQNVEMHMEKKEENNKKYIYIAFVDKEGHNLLKTICKAGKWLTPLRVEGEIIKQIKEVYSLLEAVSSGSQLLAELDEKRWKKMIETVSIIKKIIVISALPTDVTLLHGRKFVRCSSTYLSQAFTYRALAKGKISLERVYPSEEGLKPAWRVDGKYTETVREVLSVGRAALEKLKNTALNQQSEGGVDLKATPADVKINVDLRTALADVKMSNELKVALEAAAGEFWSRVEELLTRWSEAEKNGDKEAVDRLGKYLRVLLPLAYAVEAYKRGELPREEAALAVIFAMLYDGAVYRGEIRLIVGGPEQEEKPLMTRDHFTVFWLWALRELGFKPSSVRRSTNARHIVFGGNGLNELLKALVPALPTLYGLRDALAEFADAFEVVTRELVKRKFDINWAYDMKNEMFFKKLEEVVTMVEDYIYRNVTVERGPLDTSGQWPKAIIRFKLGGKEATYITVYWRGDELYAQFGGSRENAQQLASIIRALGGEAEVKYVEGTGWKVQLYTDGIIAIRNNGWLNAVKSFVDELYSKGLIGEERYKQLVRDIEAGPNAVKFARIKFSVNYDNKVLVRYQPRNEDSKNAAVNALKARGLKEGVHFTVTEHGSYEIRVTKEAYAKALEALTHSSLKEGEHYSVYDKRRVIHVKKDHKDAVVNALKGAGLEEGRDFTVRGSEQYEIRITYDGLREIQRMALNGDLEAEQFIRELEDVLRRRYGQNAVNKLIEVLTPAKVEGTAELPLAVRDDKGNLIARVVDLKYEFVENGQPVGQCAGEDCRLRVVVEYELPSGERRQFKMEWYWAEKREKKDQTTVTYYYEIARPTVKDDVEVAILRTLTGEAKRGQVRLNADQLDALRRFKALKDAIDKWRESRPRGERSQNTGQGA